jgi:alpha-ketoglutarate-dependent taurine dioxygenase
MMLRTALCKTEVHPGIAVFSPQDERKRSILRVNEELHILAGAFESCGAVLLRGFDVRSVGDCDAFLRAWGGQRMDYVHGSTPRSELHDKIFTSTEYPSTEEIPLHNENSYQARWPLQIMLCCITPSESGGQTPIANMSEVGRLIPSALWSELKEKGVQYVRNYHPNIGVQWQDAFRVSTADAVTAICRERGIVAEWLPGGVLHTRYVAQGTATHPLRGEEVLFNQAHLFHVSALGEEVAQAALDCYGPELLPRNTYVGDGRAFSTSELDALRAAYRSCEQAFSWCPGDILVLDNMRFAHGRRPYTGHRKVVVALLNEYVEQVE